VHITSHNVIGQLQRRSPEALAYLIERYTAAVAATVAGILGDVGAKEDIEECVSDVFVEAWTGANHYDPARGTVRTWLTLLAKYRALDRRRHLWRHIRPPEQDLSGEADPVVAQVLSDECQQALVTAIEQLGPGVRDVMVCRYIFDMPIDDIARMLHLSRSQVDNRLSRGRQRLRQRGWANSHEGGESLGNVRR
jgi:RNA polymerase sigma-70 factor (ECF subfamily)